MSDDDSIDFKCSRTPGGRFEFCAQSKKAEAWIHEQGHAGTCFTVGAQYKADMEDHLTDLGFKVES